ncbi:hypothetical protein CK934_05435 [Chitinophaga sp. MD30]|nr:hypothetical protein CK934_05435 [Chitinophaga sp. MD30]
MRGIFFYHNFQFGNVYADMLRDAFVTLCRHQKRTATTVEKAGWIKGREDLSIWCVKNIFMNNHIDLLLNGKIVITLHPLFK